MTETPSPNSDPMVSKKMMGHDVCSTWIVVTLTTPRGITAPCLTYFQDPAQTEDKWDPGELIAPFHLDRVGSVPELPPPQERFLR